MKFSAEDSLKVFSKNKKDKLQKQNCPLNLNGQIN